VVLRHEDIRGGLGFVDVPCRVFMRPKRKRFEPFEIPSSQGPVRIEIADGSVCIFDPEGESTTTAGRLPTTSRVIW
jgi:hypothetical protein